MTMIAPPPIRPTIVPPLRNGDNLSVEEFERRYQAMPPGTRAELIEGVVYMPAALSFDFHGAPHFDLIASLGIYKRATPGIVGADNATCRLAGANLPQPDLFLMIAPGLGGTADVSDGYVDGPPELIIEVAHTSADYDLHQKMDVYRRSGVPEYAVWRTLDGAFDYFTLETGAYRRVEAGADGMVRSRMLPGLWLNVSAVLRGDWDHVDVDVRRGIASPEHVAFAAELARRRAAR